MPVEKIPSWLERLLMPKLSEISGEIKALDTKIDSLRSETKTEIDAMRKEMLSKFESVYNKFEGLDYRFETINIKLDSLEKRIPVIEEITALKIKVADMEKRLAMA
jgi:DNA repair exonuclease SbcCD ATPase subunit